MDPNGRIYADETENIPEEDVQRLDEWTDGIEADELERQRRKFEKAITAAQSTASTAGRDSA